MAEEMGIKFLAQGNRHSSLAESPILCMPGIEPGTFDYQVDVLSLGLLLSPI